MVEIWKRDDREESPESTHEEIYFHTTESQAHMARTSFYIRIYHRSLGWSEDHDREDYPGENKQKYHHHTRHIELDEDRWRESR